MSDRSSASVETLKAITAAVNAHDLDAIMAFFADDCTLDTPRASRACPKCTTAMTGTG